MKPLPLTVNDGSTATPSRPISDAVQVGWANGKAVTVLTVPPGEIFFRVPCFSVTSRSPLGRNAMATGCDSPEATSDSLYSGGGTPTARAPGTGSASRTRAMIATSPCAPLHKFPPAARHPL